MREEEFINKIFVDNFKTKLLKANIYFFIIRIKYFSNFREQLEIEIDFSHHVINNECGSLF